MSGSIQEVIQNLLNSVLPSFNTAGGPYYLPTWIVANKYDPYGKTEALTSTVNITDPTAIETAASICADIDATGEPCKDPNAFYIGAPGTQPLLVLGGNDPGDLIITGFSNAVMTYMTSQPSDPYTIVAQVEFSTLSNYPPNIEISGDFTFTEYCCCSDDQKSCSSPTPDAQTGSGTFMATVSGTSYATITFNITDLAPGVLTIGVTSTVFSVPLDANGNPEMTIDIDITSIPPSANSQTYNDAAEEAFNSPEALFNMITLINGILNQPQQLTAVGKVLQLVIDGYLQSTHQYPFNTASMALY